MRKGWAIVGWIGVVGIATGLWLRHRPAHTTPGLLVVGLMGMALFVPLLVLALSAWRSNSKPLRLAAAIMLVAYLVTFGNVHAVLGCGPEHSDDQIVVFHQNVYVRIGDPVGVAQAIVASQADVVDLVETWPGFMDELVRQPGMDAYPYRSNEPLDAPTRMAVWSRWPLHDAAIEAAGERPYLHMTVLSPHGPFLFYAIHTPAPVEPREVANWETELSELGRVDTSVPTVMAGDFNATEDHSQFRDLVDHGWTDVHDPKGCGLAQTWPMGRGTGIPLLRLDHVLVTRDFQVLGVDIGDPSGSDHRPVVATIRLTKPSGYQPPDRP